MINYRMRFPLMMTNVTFVYNERICKYVFAFICIYISNCIHIHETPGNCLLRLWWTSRKFVHVTFFSTTASRKSNVLVNVPTSNRILRRGDCIYSNRRRKKKFLREMMLVEIRMTISWEIPEPITDLRTWWYRILLAIKYICDFKIELHDLF